MSRGRCGGVVVCHKRLNLQDKTWLASIIVTFYVDILV